MDTTVLLRDLLATHTETAKSLQSTFSNYSKTPIAKRNLNNTLRVKKAIETEWSKFLENDQAIRKLDPTLSGDYFKRRLFETTKDEYTRYLEVFDEHIRRFKVSEWTDNKEKEYKIPESAVDNKIVNVMKQVSFDATSKNTPDAELNMSAGNEDDTKVIVLQFKIVNFNETLQSIQEEDAVNSKSHYQSSLHSLEKKWNDLESDWINVQAAHFKYGYDKLGMEVVSKSIQDARRCYNDYRRHVHKKLEELDNKPSRRELDIPLPPLKLVPFSGVITDWPNFCEYYETTIHNNPAIKSNVVKNEYLCSLIKDKQSLEIVGHLIMNASNYETTWSLLKERLGNPRRISDALVDKLIDMPKMENKSASNLREIHDKTKEVLFSLYNQCLQEKEILELIVMRLLQRKLDYSATEAVEKALNNSREVPPLEEYMQTLLQHSFVLENLTGFKGKSYIHTIGKPSSHFQLSHGQRARINMTNSGKACGFCSKSNHGITNCYRFKNLSISKRIEFIKKNKICYGCLSHAFVEACPEVKVVCNICQKSHNTLLHLENFNNNRQRPASALFTQVPNVEAPQNNTSPPSVAKMLTTTNLSCVLLPTAKVECENPQTHTKVYLRILIDQCATNTFITSAAADKLQLQRKDSVLGTQAVGDVATETSKHAVELVMSPHFSTKTQVAMKAQVLGKITEFLPSSTSSNRNTEEIRSLLRQRRGILADPDYDQSSHIDMIVGSDYFNKILLTGLLVSSQGPIAQQTRLGWIISGPIQAGIIKSQCMMTITQETTADLLQKFFELEEVFAETNLTSAEEDCELHYQQHMTRLKDGRFCTKIPFIQPPELGLSRGRAIGFLLHMEKRLANEPLIRDQYIKTMRNAEFDGHMVKVATTPKEEDGYYMPHHYVLKNDSTSTKVRVVFNSSANTTNKKSLNDFQHVGPRLQDNLFDTYLRWRKWKIALVSDIKQMYTQICVHPDDQKYQKIVWRYSAEEPIQDYQLTRVTFGARSAPYVAIKTLQTLANIEKERFPNAAKVAQEDFYVDDLLSGANTLTEAINLVSELNQLMASGKFELRKWASNYPESIKHLPKEFRTDQFLELDVSAEVKTLGVQWNPTTDEFHFRENIPKLPNPTKREVLSTIASIWDPLGILTPVKTVAKILMQDIWRANIEWDEKLPKDITATWISFAAGLPALDKLRVSRWFGYHGGPIELIGFCDASEKAYAAVVYARTIHNGIPQIHLLAAKSKAAPIKVKCVLPRLELCGAVLLVDVIVACKKAIKIEDCKTFAFTDSTIVLAWINGDSGRWTRFVSNRVDKINKFVPAGNWYHVRSNENPADVGSRGANADDLMSHSLWFNGPSILKTIEWKPANIQVHTTNEEARKNAKVLLTNHQVSDQFIKKYSSTTRMFRVTAFMLRWRTKQRGDLSAKEIENAHDVIIRIVQAVGLPKGIHEECLESLNPFVDENGIVRVGGRLRYSALTYDEKHPIIIPRGHHLATALIDDAHSRLLHGGATMVLAFLRRKYWMINARNAVRFRLRICMCCRRYRAKPMNQQMGDLPTERVTPSLAFSSTGIDYAGPITVRCSKVRGNQKTYKGYIVVFVCMTTKAIHLELAGDLTAQTFIAAYKRFVSRRGHVQKVFTDNGTNFQGAKTLLSNELQEAIRSANDEFKTLLASQGTEMSFIPPGSPWMGGLWESGVKSAKYHFSRIVRDTTLTYEELTTVLVQIEGCLNSRPLCKTTANPLEDHFLTPGHFLTGRAIIHPPELNYSEVYISPLKRWLHVQKLVWDFWRIWSKEYLHQLQERTKWKTAKPNIEVGDLVLMKGENLPPGNWPMGRIKKVHPGPDGLVRVVTLQLADTTKGVVRKYELKRPIHKLCHMSLESEEDSPTPKQAKRTGKPSKLMLVLCLLTLCMNTSGQVFKNLSTPGLLVVHKSTTWMQQGTWHWAIDTGTNLTKDIILLTEQYAYLDKYATKTCLQFPHVQWDPTIPRRELDNALKMLEAFKHPRNKRSGGLWGWFKEFMFGEDVDSSEVEQLSKQQKKLAVKTSGALQSTIKSLKVVEKQQQDLSIVLQKKLKQLADNLEFVNKQSQFSFAATAVLGASHAFEALVRDVTNKYVNIRQGWILTNEDWHEAVSKIKTQLPYMSLIPILGTNGNETEKAFKDNCPREIHLDGDKVMVIIQIPIVHKVPYEELQVVPIPDMVSRRIWTVGYKQLYFSHETLQYAPKDADNDEVMKLTDDIRIARMPVLKTENNIDCVTATLLKRKKVMNYCHTEVLPAGIEVIQKLPDSNHYVYYTDQLAEMSVTCPGERFEPTYSIGTITLKPNCILKSSQFVIYASTDVSTVKRKVFYIPALVALSVFPINSQLEPLDVSLNLKNSSANYTELQEAANKIKEIGLFEVPIHHHVNILWIVVCTLAVTIIIIAVLMVWRFHGVITPHQVMNNIPLQYRPASERRSVNLPLEDWPVM